MKAYLAISTFAYLAVQTFGQLENAAYFSPGECVSPDAGISFYTQNYYEFSKLYNAPTREEAAENFRKLLENAKTDEAKAWAFFGLRSLGYANVPKKIENVCLFTGKMGALKRDVYIHSDTNIKIPEEYADIDLRDFDLPSDTCAYAKSVLCESGMYAIQAIGGDGIIPAEVWAFNYLAADKNDSEIADTAKEIWECAKNFEGRLYALLLFKKAGNESEFVKRLARLNPREEFTQMGGCIIMKNSTLENTPDIEKLFDVKYAFKKSLSKYPQCVNPRDKNANLIPLRKIKVPLLKAEVKEDNLGYLPMRFRSEGTEFLCGEGLENLAKQWHYAKKPSHRRTLENILNKYLIPNAPAKFIAYYDTYESVFVEERGGKYFFIMSKPKLGDEPCFDTLYYASTKLRQFEKRVFNGLVKSKLCGDNDNDISFAYIFHSANRIATESLEIDGLYKKEFAKEIASRVNPEEILGEFLVLSKFGENRSAWLCPIFKDTPIGQIERLQKQHVFYLNAMDGDERKSYYLLSKKYKTILDYDKLNNRK